MKKNIFKKIVASLATVAMAAGLFTAMPVEEAKAAEVTKEVIFVLSDDKNVKDVYVQMDTNVAEAVSEEADLPCWEGQKALKTTSLGDGKYKLTLKVTAPVIPKNEETGENNYCSLKFVAVDKDGKMVKGQDVYAQNYAEKYNAADTVYISMDMSANDWVDGGAVIDITTKDPTKVDASEVVAAIDAIGKVELTKESENKIKSAESKYDNFVKIGGDKADVTNYDKLTAARAAYDKLVADADAKAAGDVIVYVKNDNWTTMSVYGWDGVDVGEWPGKALTPLKENKGWFSVNLTVSKAAKLIFNSGKEQTVNWENVPAGTYWLVLSEKADNGQYKVDNVSTKAPTGWKEEAAEKIENKAPVKTTTTTDKGSVATKDDIAKIDKEAVVEGVPEGAKLDATEIAADSDAFKVVKEAAKTAFKNKAYVALDLKLLKGTEAVQPNGDVKVTIPVPSALAKAKKVAVYRVGDDNKLVSCGTADVANGKLTFTTNHFSTYVFADATPATNTGDAAPIVFMLAVAAVAASMVIASKKKTICE